MNQGCSGDSDEKRFDDCQETFEIQTMWEAMRWLLNELKIFKLLFLLTNANVNEDMFRQM